MRIVNIEMEHKFSPKLFARFVHRKEVIEMVQETRFPLIAIVNFVEWRVNFQFNAMNNTIVAKPICGLF